MKKEKQSSTSTSGKKIITGVITSAKMSQTAVVSMRRLVEHPKYRKRYWVTKAYKAHNPGDIYKEGQRVMIQESRPLSKEKKWIIIAKVS